ncbi:MAG TPA: GNAT family N-acetyltransferase [Dehalococcoidia bacterium]|nr:GNAT family N-acetyltransferase [Dehalococcoidia bacterium]
MYWRIGRAYTRRPREQNRAALRALAMEGPPPGLLAFDRDLAVGWCQLTPRSALPWLNGRLSLGADGERVWSASCFYVRRGYRRRGVSSALIAAAVQTAKEAGASSLEAYPVDTNHAQSTRNVFTGTASAFRRAGFKRVAERPHGRLVMRHDLEHP